ncbi:MAG TPA: hypothetical protein VKB78_03000 [Pirellulales bacterium]|nr:hypothetical protein [Pirellulales bacterium]
MRQSLSANDVFQVIAIVVMSILAAVIYGILHDQVTARICIEYFTIGHPDLGRPEIFHSNNPTVIGIAWGFVATWWVGLMLGVPLAIAARAGRWPKRTARSLVRPIAMLMAVNAVCAFIAGFAGWIAASRGANAEVVSFLSPEKRVPFIAVWYAHQSSYAVGFIGGVIVLSLIFYWRVKAGSRRS